MADKRIRRLIEIVFDRRSAEQVEEGIKGSLRRAAREGGDNFLRELKSVFNKRMADLRIELSKGIIDQKQFRQRANEAAKAFNEELISRIEELRDQGKMTDAEYVKLSRSLKRVGDDGGKAIGGLRQGMQHLRAMVLSLGGALAGLFAVNRIRAWITESTKLAARYETLGVTLQQVGQNAGYSADELNRTTKSLQDGGISMLESRSAAARLISAQIDLAHATDLARIAQDAAVIGNINSSEAFGRMIDGIASGNVQVLRNIGLNVNFQRSYQQLAAQIGKNVGDLTELERAQARANSVIEAGVGIAGTYEASLAAAGKQAGSNIRLLQDLQVKVGQVFLPAFTEAVFEYSDALKSAHEWIDNLEQSKIDEWAQRFVDGVRLMIATVRELTLRLRALGTAIVVVSGVTVVGRLIVSVRAANAAAVTFMGTIRGFYPLLGPKGWFIVGVSVLTEAFFRMGGAAREAAREAKEALADFRASLQAMDRAELEARSSALGNRIRDLDTSIAAEQRLIEEKHRAAIYAEDEHGRHMARAEKARAQQRLREAEQTRETLIAQYRSVLEALKEIHAQMPDIIPGGSGEGDPPAAATEEAMRKIVELLAKGHELELLTREERLAAFQLAVDTRAELARTNLTLERRIELTQRLAQLEAVTGEVPYTPQVTPAAPDAAPMVLTPQRTQEMRTQVSEWQLMLSQLGDHSHTVAMYMERSFTDFFTAMATGFDSTRDGFHSLTDAAAGIGASIVAGLAGGMRDYHLAQSVGKLAEGIWPPNPAALAAAAQHVAAAGLFGALEGFAAGAGRRRAAAPATSPGYVGRDAANTAHANQAAPIIYIDPFNPDSPVHARQVGKAYKLDVRLAGGARR